MKAAIRPAITLFAMLTVVTGVIYPLAVTGLGQLLFPDAANASPGERAGRPVGSALVGQPLSDPRFFWGRPSATAPGPYDGRASAASNLGPSNPALVASVRARIAALRASDPDGSDPVPVDLVTASASGLDPHVSPAAALYQVRRVAEARGVPARAVRALVERHVEPPLLGVFGAPRVNVLALDLALDDLCARGVDAVRPGARRPHP
jgi:K+-transporting ATPase ATPase C chain